MDSMGFRRGMKRKSDFSVEKPREVGVVAFAQSRASEIEALAKDIKTNTGTRKLFQSLPIHMRRRAMSHNIKRLPRRLQKFATTELDKTVKHKRPSRRHRRRPKNLLQEYQRRQRKHVWLETHIWHAKRFKMEDRWGYRLALHSREKSIKASYRATQHYCQIQDLSYMCCIEISGGEKEILEGLSHLTSPKTGKTFAAKTCISGTREGQTVVYKYDQYPYNAIGCVQYLWKPDDGSRRQLWIWCHPSCYNELWEELKVSYDNDLMMTKEPSPDSTDKSEKLENGEQQSFNAGEINVTSLKDKLNRHRLTGPAANQILHQVFKPANILPKDTTNQWWLTYYQETSRSVAFTQQGELIESLETTPSPGEYNPHCVVGMTVGDPRIKRPEKRTKVKQNNDMESDNFLSSEKIHPDMSMSALWYSDIRDKVKNTKMSDQELNELKSDELIPGAFHELGLEESRIPVIMIQNPGVRQGSSNNYGSGWDIILPQNWSKAFWIGFIYRGARAAGLRDLESLAFEQKLPFSPNDYPDTTAGKLHDQNKAEKLKSKYDRRPPAKRCNYTKLGIVSPFSFPWCRLIQEWNDGETCERRYVLREWMVLKRLREVFSLNNKHVNQKQITKSTSVKTENLSELVSDHRLSLVQVELTMLSRGVPDEYAVICIPTEEDLTLLKNDSMYSGPKEPVHKDESNKSRKKKTRVDNSVKSCTSTTQQKGIRNSCSREIIGYINRGGFTLGSGKGSGQGFCAVLGIKHLLEKFSSGNSIFVLTKNPTSYQYRFASVNIT